jgi:glycogenin glucosyltransferase
MWYSVPESRPAPEEAPKAIFPWETQSRRAATTRKFAEDSPPSPAQEQFSPREAEWASSSGGIEKYIRNIMTQSEQSKQPEITSPTGRRESLVFTGMPSMKDRPSLPVTPAPERTNTFWGEDEGPAFSPDVLPEQVQWVCPSCGFASDDSNAFVSSRPAAQHHHASSPSNSKIAIDEPPKSETRPAPPRRERSSGTSVFSDSSTIVAFQSTSEPHMPTIEASPELEPESEPKPIKERPLPPHLQPLPAQSSGSSKPSAIIIPPTPQPPVTTPPPPAPPSPQKPLPPPAWLTAAVVERAYPALPSALY